tara:strand:+ start:315 stop:1034 length:720 start_codon:yes stop_codon:yes gene_type:complete
MRIIPAIDIIEGKCVRLSKGDYSTKKIYNENPLEVAKQYEAHGLNYLHLVDLDGAKSNHIVNYSVLEEIATKTSLKIDFGGGLKSDKDLKIAFDCGANQITGGSIAIKNQNLFKSWINRYGPEKVILGADFKGKEIYTHGWTQKSDQNLLNFLKEYSKIGIKYVICTDINRDGSLNGPSINSYKKTISYFPKLKLIASGGVSSIADLEELFNIGCESVIVGKAIYEKKIELKQLENFFV